MINQYEVSSYIEDELPEIKKELKEIDPTLNVFKSVQCLTDYTIRKAKQHDFRAVKKSFATAEKIYSKGNTEVKTAMENVFVYSFSRLLVLCSRYEKKYLQAIMPLCLHTAYVQQIYRSGL